MKPQHQSIAVVVTFVVIFVLAVADIQTLDVWLHLRTGEQVWHTGRFPRQDSFSYTATGPWIAHEWGAGLLYYVIFQISGLPGLVLSNALLIVAYLYVIYRASGPRCSTALLVLLAALAIRGHERFFIRPDSLTLLYTAAFLWIFRIGQRRWPAAIWTLPAIELVWANTHGGGCILGLVLTATLMLGEKRLRPGLLAAMLLAALANPYGWKVPFYFLNAFGQGFADIEEWRRSVPSDFFGPAGILLGLAIFALCKRKCTLVDALIFLSLGALGLRSARFIPLALLGSLPLAASVVQHRLPALLLALVSLVCAAFTLTGTDSSSPYRLGLGVNERFLPVQAAAFVRNHHVDGPLFNSYGFGGYLLWQLDPMKDFIDGRFDLFGEEFVERYRRFPEASIWNALVAQYQFSFALIDNEPHHVTETLDKDPAWALVYWDDRSLLYLRATPENLPLIKTYRYRLLQPNNPDWAYLAAIARDRRPQLLEELERSFNGSNDLNAHLMRAFVCQAGPKAADLQQALADYRAVEQALPRRASAWRQSGILELTLQHYSEARADLERATRLAPGDFEAHHRLSVADYFLHDRPGALEQCRMALAIDPNSAAARRNFELFSRP